jgi:DNA-binding PadR family transcriptional regulator
MLFLMRSEALKGHLDLLVLSVLHNAPAHGYAVIHRLAEDSGGAFDLPEGTIYPALYRLERAGLLASDESVVDGRRRRVYRLTPAGEQALGERVGEWEQFARSVARTLAAGA